MYCIHMNYNGVAMMKDYSLSKLSWRGKNRE